MRRRTIGWLAAALLNLAAVGAGAQEAAESAAESGTKAAANAAAQNPAPISTFEFEGAYLHNFSGQGKNESNYRITYKGALVREQGTPFKSLAAFDPAAAAPDTTGIGSGDRSRLSLRYENGEAIAGGALFEAAGVAPITLRGLESLELRGSAAAASDAEGKNVEFAVGLETRPFRLPGLDGTEASNWIVFGINAQRTKTTAADGSATTINSAMLNARAFVGKAFGWRKSADVGKTASKLERDILAAAPTLDDAMRLATKIEKIPAAKRTALQRQIFDVVGDLETDADWTKKVREAALGVADAITDQPTFAAYAEAHGWYSATGTADEWRARGLFTATLDYWLMPTSDDVLLRLRYESGWDWARPAERLNRVLVSLALRY